jgi:hypothetical protein
MNLKWIAQRLHMGSWTYVSNQLKEQPPNAAATGKAVPAIIETLTKGHLGLARLQQPLPPGREMGLSDSHAPAGLRQSPSASAWSSAFFISPCIGGQNLSLDPFPPCL